MVSCFILCNEERELMQVRKKAHFVNVTLLRVVYFVNEASRK